MNQTQLPKKVYISGALTGIESVEKVKIFYEEIGLICEELGFQVHIPHLYTDPLKNSDISPFQVFTTDKYKVNTSDLLIAYLGYPSFGVGMELAYADVQSIPVIILYERGKVISRFPRGIPTILSELQFASYEDALDQLKSVLLSWKQASGIDAS